MRTFYISSSSHPDNLDKVLLLAARLIDAGLVWHYNWVEEVVAVRRGKVANIQEGIRADLEAARDCDLFVFLDSPHMSRGGMIEYGVRLLDGKVHHIDAVEPDYFFFQLDSVTHYNMEEFCATHQI